MIPRIEVDRLTKSFGSSTVVDAVSFSVASREIFGFLGPNGAGKTTTIKMMSTLLAPTHGTVRIAGYDVVRDRMKVRQRIGMVFQDPTLDERLTGWENLRFHGLLYGLSTKDTRQRADELLDLVGLSDKQHQLVKSYSGGMKRRLELARGMIHQPPVLFWDEPTVGLDPQTRHQVWQTIEQLVKQNDTSVFVTTHYMDEAELCHRVAIMDNGQLIALDTPEALKRQIGKGRIAMQLATSPDVRTQTIWQEALGAGLQGRGNSWTYETDQIARDLPRVVSVLGDLIVQLEVKDPTLEDVFLRLTGKKIRDEGPQTSRPPWMRERGR